MHTSALLRPRIGRVYVALAAVIALLLAVPPLASSVDAAGRRAPVRLKVVSNRADLVSGGNALVRVGLPDGVKAKSLQVSLNGRDISKRFARRANGKVMGLVKGLKLGANRLTARLPDGRGATLTITNHPRGGPVFSGPQIQPWTCANGDRDKCNRKPSYAFYYKPTGGTGLEPYDPGSPPSDVDTTTTNEGKTVPFIVREETGNLARDQYKIAVLFDPEKRWKPWKPQDGYNGRVVITHGASCDTEYQMGEAPDVLETGMLGQGFGILSHALDNAGHNCNIVTQAESLVMTKERFIERYGRIRWTIGSGCSGGALTQQQVANAYPGIYQGITPACSFTDSFSSGMQKEDYNLLRRYFENPARWDASTGGWTPAQMGNVYGHPNLANPITFTEVIPDNADPSRECNGVPPEDVFHHETNPDGVRCSIQDYMINVFGEREGFDDGKAGRPASNVGIQYGLSGLREGLLTPAQFVDVNVKVGSRDVDGEWQPARRYADRPALRRAFRSGAVNTANHLDKVAIIDLRGPDPGAFHDVYRTYAMRDRLLREHGTAQNQVLWRGPVALFGDATFVDESVFAVDRWLAAVAADTRDVPRAQKILDARKTAGVEDRCTDGAGQDTDPSECDAVVESYSTPRFEAGMPVADDTIECQLRPMSREDYLPVQFTFEQWAALREVFPNGVCDYDKPSVDQRGAIRWLTYQRPDGDVIYGGKWLGRRPVSRPFVSAGSAGR